MIMTGHTIIAALGYGALSIYAPYILRNLYPSFANMYFEHYVNIAQDSLLEYFSPITLMANLNSYKFNTWLLSDHVTYFIGALLFVIIVCFIAFILYKLRPSEAAGRAMAFEKFNSPIRILLVIPISLYIGLFLVDISYFAEELWLFFGIIFGGFVIHSLIQCIFEFDVRALFTKKLQLLFSLLFGCGFALFFIFDVIKYDEYLPELNELDSIYISSNMIQESKFYFSEFDEELHNDGIRGDNLKLALKAAEDVLENSNPKSWDDNTYADSITFEYKLKNGQSKFRQYSINVNQIPDTLDKLSTTRDFKDDICSLYKFDSKKFKQVSCMTGIDTIFLNITDIQKKELFDTYLDEFSSLSLSDACQQPVILSLNSDYKQNNSVSFSVYESFYNTTALLKEYGAIPLKDIANLEPISMEIHSGKYNTYENYGSITDTDTMNEIMKYIYPAELNWNFHNNKMIYGSLTFNKEYNGNKYLDFYINSDDLDLILK